MRKAAVWWRDSLELAALRDRWNRLAIGTRVRVWANPSHCGVSTFDETSSAAWIHRGTVVIRLWRNGGKIVPVAHLEEAP